MLFHESEWVLLRGEAQHRSRARQHPKAAAAASLQLLDVLSGLNLQLETPLSNMAHYKHDEKTPEWWTPWNKIFLGHERPAGTLTPALGSSSIMKPPTSQCKWLGRPKFQGTKSCSCVFPTCCMSKRKGNPAKALLSSTEQCNWSFNFVFNPDFCLGNFNRSCLNQKDFSFLFHFYAA